MNNNFVVSNRAFTFIHAKKNMCQSKHKKKEKMWIKDYNKIQLSFICTDLSEYYYELKNQLYHIIYIWYLLLHCHCFDFYSRFHGDCVLQYMLWLEANYYQWQNYTHFLSEFNKTSHDMGCSRYYGFLSSFLQTITATSQSLTIFQKMKSPYYYISYWSDINLNGNFKLSVYSQQVQ